MAPFLTLDKLKRFETGSLLMVFIFITIVNSGYRSKLLEERDYFLNFGIFNTPSTFTGENH